MANNGLKMLFTEYSNGRISFEEYRNRRTQIIDEITGEITVRNNEFSPPTNPSYQAPHVEVINSVTKKKSSAPVLISIFAIIFIIFATAIIINNIRTDTASKNDIQPDNLRSDIPNTPAISHQNTQQLALNFIKLDQWQVSDVDTFLINWKSLSTEERKYAHTTSWFLELKNTVKSRITEQRALADIGDNNATTLEKHIQTLADELTVNEE